MINQLKKKKNVIKIERKKEADLDLVIKKDVHVQRIEREGNFLLLETLKN
jgi:hypothetical protein